jgi:hypothetical protein
VKEILPEWWGDFDSLPLNYLDRQWQRDLQKTGVTEMITKQIEFNIPEDKEVQAALGVLVVRHGHLEYLLRLTVKSLLQLPIHEALTQTNKKGVKALREKIEKEAKERLRQGIALDNLLDFLKGLGKHQISGIFLSIMYGRTNVVDH